MAISGDRDPGRIVAAILQPPQPLNDDWNYTLLADVTGNSLDLGLRLFARESSVQRELKRLSLANALQTSVTHLLEGALDGLALGVKNAFLERDVDVGYHERSIIREQVRVRRAQSDLGFQASDLGP